MKRKGFTLLELLIVISILSILATVTVLLLNPVEYLRQGRDTKRIADIGMLNVALSEAVSSGVSLGTASTTVYVSLLDTASSTCGTLGLPPLPGGYQYHCVTTAADLSKADGNGWVPVNFSSIQGGSSMTILPTDPTNSATYFYTYIPGGSFALSAMLESDKYLKQEAMTDGGTNPGKIEMGSDLSLLAKADGLVGYWPLDEGGGTTAHDASGNGNTGTGASAGWISAGCPQGGCITMTALSGAITVPSSAKLDIHSNFTISNWVRINTAIPAASWPGSFGGSTSHIGYGFRSVSTGTNWMFEYGTDYPTCSGTIWSSTGSQQLNTNEWHLLTATYDGANINTYIDGVLKNTKAFATGMCTSFPMVIGGAVVSPGSFSVDEARLYGRVLSASEIKAIYSATK